MSAKRKLSIGCGVTALFGLGVVTGLVAAVFFVANVAKRSDSWNTEESREFITSHLENVLDLDAEQKAAVAVLVSEALGERWEMRQEYREQTDRLFVEKYGPRLREILTEEQQVKLRKRWGKWRSSKGLDPESGVTAEPGDEGKAHVEDGDGE